MVWSGLDSNSGSITFSRHWSERLEAVTLPEVLIVAAIVVVAFLAYRGRRA